MSQSDEHRQLVLAAARAIERCSPGIRVRLDIQERPGDRVPPLIGGFRPDIIGRSRGEESKLVIGEAKTGGDIDNQHTVSQIRAFVDYLHAAPYDVGVFVLAVDGTVADLARTVLRFSCRHRVASRLRIALFDRLDFWLLGQVKGPPWRLC